MNSLDNSYALTELPLELFKSVLSILESPKTLTVCKLWNATLVNHLKQKEHLLLQIFVDWTNNILDSDLKNIQEGLIQIINDSKNLNISNWLEIKSISHKTCDKFAFLLKDLDKELLKFLEFNARIEKKPKFYKDVLFLAKSKREVAFEMTQEPMHWNKNIAYLINDLIVHGFNEQAFIISEKFQPIKV